MPHIPLARGVVGDSNPVSWFQEVQDKCMTSGGFDHCWGIFEEF